MAAIISRRLRLTSTLLKSSSSFIFPPTFSQSKTPSTNSFPKNPPQTNARSFYQFIPNSSLSRPIFFSTHDSPPPPPSLYSYSESIFKHQEIEGPTVELDLSQLDNETREFIKGIMKYMDKINTIMGLMSLIPLGLGAWIPYVTLCYPITEVSVQSLMAVAFLSSVPVVTFMLCHALKPICFIKKMEKQGRFHIHVGSRGISFASVAAISAGFVFYIMILKFINSAS